MHIISIGVVMLGSGSFLLVAHNEERKWEEGELLGLYLTPQSLALTTFCVLYIIFSYYNSKNYKDDAEKMYQLCMGPEVQGVNLRSERLENG